LVLTWWIALAGSTALAGSILEQTWPDWWRAVLALLVQWLFDLLDRVLIPKGLRL